MIKFSRSVDPNPEPEPKFSIDNKKLPRSPKRDGWNLRIVGGEFGHFDDAVSLVVSDEEGRMETYVPYDPVTMTVRVPIGVGDGTFNYITLPLVETKAAAAKPQTPTDALIDEMKSLTKKAG